jgi:hypothetical protein
MPIFSITIRLTSLPAHGTNRGAVSRQFLKINLMKNLILYLIILIAFEDCSKKTAENVSLIFNFQTIDTVKKIALDSIEFESLIKYNPYIKREFFIQQSLYADGFWLKSHLDSIESDIVFNNFKDTKFYKLEKTLTINNTICKLIFTSKSTDKFQEEFACVYLIIPTPEIKYPKTLLLIQKMKSFSLASINSQTTSVLLNKTTFIQKTIDESCASDLPGPKDELSCMTDTTINYFYAKDVSLPFRRTFHWSMFKK